MEKQAKEVEKQNQALQMPLKMAEQRITELNDKLSLYERDERKWKVSNRLSIIFLIFERNIFEICSLMSVFLFS